MHEKAKAHAEIFCQVFQNMPVNAFSIVVFAKKWIILLPKFSFFWDFQIQENLKFAREIRVYKKCFRSRIQNQLTKTSTEKEYTNEPNFWSGKKFFRKIYLLTPIQKEIT